MDVHDCTVCPCSTPGETHCPCLHGRKPETDSEQYRERAEATIAVLRARVSHYEALLVAVRSEALHDAADAIESRRSEHWQRHLREHPYADGKSCPGDYAAHDAYYDAAKVVRALLTSPGGEG